MKLRIAVCDDDAAESDKLAAIVSSWSESSGNSAETVAYPSAEAFLFDFEQTKNFDLLLLDIEMGGMSGVDLAKKLRSEKSALEIIFVTSHTEFYGEGYEVDALHYLIKPVKTEKLFRTLDRAADILSAVSPPVIITVGGETLRLEQREIIFVESCLHYISIQTEKGEYRVKENLSDFEARLSKGFFRCHRSYLVSLSHVKRISRTAVLLSNEKVLPLSRGKYDEINRAYIDHYS